MDLHFNSPPSFSASCYFQTIPRHQLGESTSLPAPAGSQPALSQLPARCSCLAVHLSNFCSCGLLLLLPDLPGEIPRWRLWLGGPILHGARGVALGQGCGPDVRADAVSCGHRPRAWPPSCGEVLFHSQRCVEVAGVFRTCWP